MFNWDELSVVIILVYRYVEARREFCVAHVDLRLDYVFWFGSLQSFSPQFFEAFVVVCLVFSEHPYSREIRAVEDFGVKRTAEMPFMVFNAELLVGFRIQIQNMDTRLPQIARNVSFFTLPPFEQAEHTCREP